MILYYAMGGGLGHLTRAVAFLNTFDLNKNSAILTSSKYASDKRVVGDFKIIWADEKFESNFQAFQEFLRHIFSEIKIETLYIDSFPFGIIGEFVEFEFAQRIEINYVARLLKWENYSDIQKGKSIQFKKTFVLEPLEKEHQEFIDKHSAEQIKIELKYPNENLTLNDTQIFQHILNNLSPFWLVVHAGNDEETAELINFADEMREIEKASVNLIFISPNVTPFQTPNLFQFNLYPASILFKHAGRIFSACGFNVMRQAADFRNKHHFIPFERRYDDQFARARRFRKAD